MPFCCRPPGACVATQSPLNLAVLFNLGGPDAGLLRSFSGWLTQVGWRLASVWLVFGCSRRGLGPRTRPAGAQAPAALAGWWLFVWGPYGHDGKRLQCHSALDAALPCYASYGRVTHGLSRERCGCYPPLRFRSLTFIAPSHVRGES